MINKEIISFDRDDIKAMKRICPKLSKEELLYNWAKSQGYCGGQYDVYITGNRVIITELP